jgi:ClpP class serine protease
MSDEARVGLEAVEDKAIEKEDWEHVGSVLVALRQKPDEEQVKSMIAKHIHALIRKHKVQDYKILLLLDDRDQISTWHSDRIYQGANEDEVRKNILLLIHSRGGSIEPAYLISKTCKRLSKDRFVVGIPRASLNNPAHLA